MIYISGRQVIHAVNKNVCFRRQRLVLVNYKGRPVNEDKEEQSEILTVFVSM